MDDWITLSWSLNCRWTLNLNERNSLLNCHPLAAGMRRVWISYRCLSLVHSKRKKKKKDYINFIKKKIRIVLYSFPRNTTSPLRFISRLIQRPQDRKNPANLPNPSLDFRHHTERHIKVHSFRRSIRRFAQLYIFSQTLSTLLLCFARDAYNKWTNYTRRQLYDSRAGKITQRLHAAAAVYSRVRWKSKFQDIRHECRSLVGQWGAMEN